MLCLFLFLLKIFPFFFLNVFVVVKIMASRRCQWNLWICWIISQNGIWKYDWVYEPWCREVILYYQSWTNLITCPLSNVENFLSLDKGERESIGEGREIQSRRKTQPTSAGFEAGESAHKKRNMLASRKPKTLPDQQPARKGGL